jgi:hypothetical protein
MVFEGGHRGRGRSGPGTAALIGAAALAFAFACPSAGAVPAQATPEIRTRTEFAPPPRGIEGRKVVECLGDPACRIVVGDSAVGYVRFWCWNGSKYVKDAVRILIAGHPQTGDATATFQPRKVFTNPPTKEYSKLTIKTTRKTKPQDYVLQIWGIGDKCRTYPIIYANLRVAPKITHEKDVVWWFGGEKPEGYTFEAELTAHAPGEQAYSWKITNGKEYAEFKGGGSVEITEKNSIKVKAKAEKPEDLPKNKGDFRVTVKVNGVESDPVKLRVKRPYEARFIRNDDNQDDTFGYRTLIYYRLLDQFGVPLPKVVPAREHFTGGLIKYPDFPDNNWRRGDEGSGKDGVAGQLKDTITGQHLVHVPPFKPKAQQPQSPRGNEKIHRWRGEVWVGSTDPKGVKVMVLTWVRFRDHARHCAIQSPPGNSLPSPCPNGP